MPETDGLESKALAVVIAVAAFLLPVGMMFYARAREHHSPRICRTIQCAAPCILLAIIAAVHHPSAQLILNKDGPGIVRNIMGAMFLVGAYFRFR